MTPQERAESILRAVKLTDLMSATLGDLVGLRETIARHIAEAVAAEPQAYRDNLARITEKAWRRRFARQLGEMMLIAGLTEIDAGLYSTDPVRPRMIADNGRPGQWVRREMTREECAEEDREWRRDWQAAFARSPRSVARRLTRAEAQALAAADGVSIEVTFPERAVLYRDERVAVGYSSLYFVPSQSESRLVLSVDLAEGGIYIVQGDLQNIVVADGRIRGRFRGGR